MITHVELSLLSEALRQRVLAEYALIIRDEHHRLSYQEAAQAYGYTYESIKSMVSRGQVRARGRAGGKYITHADMRNYLRRKKCNGAPRKALRGLQTTID
jgi:hypothetical protein